MRYQYNDHLGSGSVLVNEVGTVEERVSYDVWGQARDWASWSKSFDPALLETLASGFTGHQSELGVGLMNMRGRMYSPPLGRLLSVDPVVESTGDAQTWNAYSDVLNNPLQYTDPSGLAVDDGSGPELLQIFLGGCRTPRGKVIEGTKLEKESPFNPLGGMKSCVICVTSLVDAVANGSFVFPAVRYLCPSKEWFSSPSRALGFTSTHTGVSFGRATRQLAGPGDYVVFNKVVDGHF